MIKAVLFDLDGTLIDTNELIVNSFKHTYNKHLNIMVEAKDIVMHFGEPLRSTLARYDEENVDELYNTYITYNDQMHDELVKDFDTVKETLEKLKDKGIKLAVVTSKRKEMTIKGLKFTGLYEFMDVIITPEDTEKHKPSGEPALKACSILNVEPAEAIMVGDSHFDILCGKNAGTKTCLVKYSVLPLESLIKHEPDYVIEKMDEILKYI